MSTAEREIQARLASLADLCDEIERNTGAAPGATAVVDHALLLARRIGAQLATARTAPLAEAATTLVHAERQARLILELQGQTFAHAQAIEVLARLAIRDGYRTIMRQARELGVVRTDDRANHEPALVIEPMTTPVTFTQGDARVGARHRASDSTALPFPVVFAPPYPEAAVSALSVLHHEVGHNLDHALQITEELTPRFEARAPEGNRPGWPSWTREVVADALGTLLAGAGLGRELLKWRAVYPGRDGGRSHAHPPLLARGALCYHWLSELGLPLDEPTIADLVRARDEHAAGSAEDAALVRDLAALVLTHPLRALNGGALRDLARDLARDHAGAVAAARRDDAPLDDVPDRLWPLVAALRVERGVDDARVARDMMRGAAGRTRGDASAQAWLFQADLMSAARPTVLDYRAGWRKVPPVELIARARDVTFVGATNDTLPEMLAKAHKLAGRCLESLTIYFLHPDAVRAMAPDPAHADAHVARGRRARGEFGDSLLASVATRWEILEFDRPYFFASYFDADRPGGRIHVSSHGWGQDIKEAPAIDYVWPPEKARPGRAYAWYRQALDGLRREARLIRWGGAS